VFKVKFSHFEDRLDANNLVSIFRQKKASRHESFYRKQTRAAAYVVDAEGKTIGEPLFTGVAVTHPKDMFCRAKGRKVAFGRLLQNFPRKERLAAWSEFFFVNEDY
jgi:hypothetical protein